MLWLLSGIIIFSCSAPPGKTNINEIKKESIKTKPSTNATDTIIINFPAAIFFTPDSFQLEAIRSITDSIVFESMKHDCFFQMRNSRNLLTSQYPKIKIREAANARYLLFEMIDGQKKIIDLNQNNDPCGVYLFHPAKQPKLTDMTNIDTELGFYFPK